jgi:hypothetical protein
MVPAWTALDSAVDMKLANRARVRDPTHVAWCHLNDRRTFAAFPQGSMDRIRNRLAVTI